MMLRKKCLKAEQLLNLTIEGRMKLPQKLLLLGKVLIRLVKGSLDRESSNNIYDLRLLQ